MFHHYLLKTYFKKEQIKKKDNYEEKIIPHNLTYDYNAYLLMPMTAKITTII